MRKSCFIVSDDGQKAIWTVNAKWKRVAAIGKSLGFEWGGDWSSFKDYPHLQMTGGLTLSQLQAGKRPNLQVK
ncbi:MAG: M15 family metallopeptidase [Bacillota bacterium]|uniref:M15 family metallopeptidase n=1 Tax=Virgibacillus TaxID=84406 RepID=UPI000411D47E|nr:MULTISPECIES: M15 family metallopeptidase [Bacillaceae]MCC2250688.1 M15 family metallopeptidase [Virgibacillus sp. AGTR]MDY7045791.1 M15 family metallopeptidase [Virgibacillus sp. M23]WBX79416.1 M15 family metallopeptidase [Virgibacillus salarius]